MPLFQEMWRIWDPPGLSANQGRWFPSNLPPPSPIVVSRSLQTLAKKHEAFAALALELGYAFMPRQKLQRMIGESIARRMIHRSGMYVYQSMAFHVPNVHIQTAEQFFSVGLQPDTPHNVSTWKMETFEEMEETFPQLLAMSGFLCAGLTRALQEPLERVCRVVAVLLPGAEVSHVAFPRGADRLYLNSDYVLADESGELHPLKDSKRREKELDNELLLRQKLYQDLKALFRQGVQLSPGFLRQIGEHACADDVEARLLNQSAAQQQGSTALEAFQERDRFEVQAISDEKMMRGVMHYLVLWAGYHPSWEQWRMAGSGVPGDPIESWEPWENVEGTVALTAWEARQ